MAAEYELMMDELDEDTCWRLLGRAGFGRVAFVRDGDVAVLPVNSAVVDRRVVFRTGWTSSLASLGAGARVGFEADHADYVAESGWSVLVRGRLSDVTDGPESKSWSELAVHPWAPPPRDRWMMIEPTLVTGRIVQRHRRLAPGEQVSYMQPD
jgi:nitroimidazol reductase NimA-like FMN-containing flavoprotein (pyridoxamine 5'-phosphate oxidase superfamily)